MHLKKQEDTNSGRHLLNTEKIMFTVSEQGRIRVLMN